MSGRVAAAPDRPPARPAARTRARGPIAPTTVTGESVIAPMAAGKQAIVRKIWKLTDSSDSSPVLKEDIAPLTDALDKVVALRGVSYQRKDAAAERRSASLVVARHRGCTTT